MERMWIILSCKLYNLPLAYHYPTENIRLPFDVILKEDWTLKAHGYRGIRQVS
jgi:hypothetical protein